LKSTETATRSQALNAVNDFSNFGSLKSTETPVEGYSIPSQWDFSNFGSLKSTETRTRARCGTPHRRFQQFRLVEEH